MKRCSDLLEGAGPAAEKAAATAETAVAGGAAAAAETAGAELATATAETAGAGRAATA